MGLHEPPPGWSPWAALAWAAQAANPDRTFNVADYDNNVAAAVDACWAAGGGTVVVPRGDWDWTTGEPIDPCGNA